MRPKRYPYSFKPNLMNILDSRFYTRLIVETEDGEKKIAEVTLDDVTTAIFFSPSSVSTISRV